MDFALVSLSLSVVNLINRSVLELDTFGLPDPGNRRID